MPRTTQLTSKVRALLTQLRTVDSLRAENAALVAENAALQRDLAGIASMLGTSLRRSSRGGRPRGGRLPGRPAGRRAGSKRFRTSADAVDRMYRALASKAPSDWKTKEEICRSAGLEVAKCKAAWKRASEGYEANGKKHAAVLKSNGQRGLGGRYKAV